MKCLSCNSEMQQISVSGVEIDACMNCGGIWFDNFELKKLDEKHEGKGDILDKLLSFARVPDPDLKRECPKCNMKLRCHEYSVNTEIFIDECYGCGGIWLDGGELKAIRENFRSEKDREAAVSKMLSQNTEFKAMAENQEELKKAYEGRKSILSRMISW